MPEAAQISINEIEGFIVPQPYEAGQTLTEAEAGVLNQVLVENNRNNFRARIKAAIGDEAATAKVIEDFNASAAEYRFTLATVARQLEPWEREARSMAKKAIKAALAEPSNAEANTQFSALDDDGKSEWIDERIESVLAANPQIAEEAKNIVASRQRVAKVNLAGG